jgi:hypothetical protein
VSVWPLVITLGHAAMAATNARERVAPIRTVAELSCVSTIAVSVLTGLITMGGAYLLLGRRRARLRRLS